MKSNEETKINETHLKNNEKRLKTLTIMKIFLNNQKPQRKSLKVVRGVVVAVVVVYV